MTALSVAVAALFVVTGAVKLLGVPQSLAIRDQLRISPRLSRLIGTLEIAGAVGVLAGLVWHPLRIAALVGLALLMCGAIASRVRVHDKPMWILGDLATLAVVVGTLIWVA